MRTHDVTLTVNGTPVKAKVDDRTTLADFLRHELKLTGTHLGCEHGVCGACTIRANGRSARSCLMLAVQTDGMRIETVEGLSAVGEPLHPLQQAIIDNHGVQCGFCTPGILMTLMELLETIPDPDEETVRIWLSGNICRCTGYQGIVKAALSMAKQTAGAKP